MDRYYTRMKLCRRMDEKLHRQGQSIVLMSWMLLSIVDWAQQLVSFAFSLFCHMCRHNWSNQNKSQILYLVNLRYSASQYTELYKKQIELFIEGQNRFFTKEMWVRPMSSSATSTSGQSVSCMGRYEVDSIHTSFYPPAIMECRLCLWALAQLIKQNHMPERQIF